jgi:hypothetical protein
LAAHNSGDVRPLNPLLEQAPPKRHFVSLILRRILTAAFIAYAAYLLGPWPHHPPASDLAGTGNTLRTYTALLDITLTRILIAVFFGFVGWVFWTAPKDGRPRTKGLWYWK